MGGSRFVLHLIGGRVRGYLTALVNHLGTRDACCALGYDAKSYSSLKSLCDAYGVTIPQRPNQNASGLVQKPKPRLLRGIGVFDLHHPCHDKRLWANILRFTADFDPDVFLFGGDNMDMEPLSRWIENKKRPIEGKRIKADYEAFQREVLDALPLRDDCRRIFHLGNHEDWARQAIDLNPQGEGYWEPENNLALEGWELYEYGQTSQVGKCYFHHGEYVLQHHAAKTVQTYHRTMVYGHMHSFQAYTTVTPLDTEPHAGISIPCACHLNPHYSRNRPNSWANGFCVFYVRSNGFFNIYPVIAIDGAFTTPDGRVYE